MVSIPTDFQNKLNANIYIQKCKISGMVSAYCLDHSSVFLILAMRCLFTLSRVRVTH